MTHIRSRRFVLVIVVGLLAGLLATPAAAAPSGGSGAKAADAAAKPPTAKAVFFASDGLRQDLVQEYAGQGVMPTMADFLKKGASATGGGLLTQAPPNTGAGWYSLATGAWPGVHGSTNNTFHINGQPFGNRTSAFDPNVLQVESIAQSAERGGLKVAQVEWAG
ncbi:MAG: alkaline phosphatase family protein, partial [Acidimicrobiales bacterium]